MNDQYVLDACAIIALLKAEKGHDKVEAVLNSVPKEKAIAFLHKITLTEVAYDLLRSGVYIDIADIFATCYNLPVQITTDLSDNLIALAADFKVNYRVSFADSFVLALARLNNATVVTADHHEFSPIEKSGTVKFLWIR